jgi:RNA polymerase sigma factor (sigma-70 family)
MASDFDTRGPARKFPPTRQSAVESVASDDPVVVARAFEILVRAYWRPVYAHLRLRHNRSTEDARDLTQAFFARALERRQLTGFDPTKAKFRTYLKGALDHFALESARAERRQKRGGEATHLSLDFDMAEVDLSRLANPKDIASCFEIEWTRALFATALEALEAKCKQEGKDTHLAVFRRYVIDPELDPDMLGKPSYETLAKELGIAVTDVTNRLSWARRTFRELVLAELREITVSDDEFKAEARAVLGVDP